MRIFTFERGSKKIAPRALFPEAPLPLVRNVVATDSGGRPTVGSPSVRSGGHPTAPNNEQQVSSHEFAVDAGVVAQGIVDSLAGGGPQMRVWKVSCADGSGSRVCWLSQHNRFQVRAR